MTQLSNAETTFSTSSRNQANRLKRRNDGFPCAGPNTGRPECLVVDR